MKYNKLRAAAFLFSLSAFPCSAFADSPADISETIAASFPAPGAAFEGRIPVPPAPSAVTPDQAADAAWDDYFQQLSGMMENGGLTQAGTNRLELLVDGPEVLPSLSRDIANASKFINIEIFQWQPDSIGAQVRDMLAARVKAGAQVRVILDYYGSFKDNPKDQEIVFVDSMRKAGIDVRVRPFGLLHLDHRKVIVMDDSAGGQVAYTGGMNIGLDYQQNWHDQYCRVTGPAIGPLHASFLEDWKRLTGETLSFDLAAPAQSGPLTYVIKHTGGNSDQNIKKAYLLAINTARSSIRIEDPYMTDRDVMKALIKAGRRGVQVQMIVPALDNQKATLRAFRSHYPDMLKAGIEIYEYQPRMEHLKVAVMDHLWATIGSSNLDAQSLKYNDEMNLMTLDKGFAAELDQRIFEKDLPQSVRITKYKPSLYEAVSGHTPFLSPTFPANPADLED